MDNIKNYWTNNPLKSILFIALFVRLIAAVFSAGYAFHDDHFLVIEAAESWVEHQDWNNWLPWVQKMEYPNKVPVAQGHSLLYPGIHYLLFSGMEFLGIHNPQLKMILIRLLHALFSLIIVSVGYKITNHYTNERYAKATGLLLALLWFMPFMAVRNLVEYVSIPFILLGIWKIIQYENDDKVIKPYVLAGLLLGLAFSIRFQTIIITVGIGLVLLFKKKWKQAIVFGFSALILMILVQGILDIIVWGKPFVEFGEYVRYNLAHKTEYGVNHWYMYTTVLLGMTIPPFGLFLFIGWFLTIRKYPLLFWPSFLFFLFHNYFPNKQERFIIPIIGLFVIAGVIGWWSYMDTSKFWTKNKWLFKIIVLMFWILNMIALPVVSTTYSKRSRCQAMSYIGKQPDAKSVIVEESVRGGTTMLPTFYAGKNIHYYDLEPQRPIDSVIVERVGTPNHIEFIQSPKGIQLNEWPNPQYILFINEKKLDERVDSIKRYYPNIELVQTIYPGYMDMLMRKITPSNNNQLIFIYKINKD